MSKRPWYYMIMDKAVTAMERRIVFMMGLLLPIYELVMHTVCSCSSAWVIDVLESHANGMPCPQNAGQTEAPGPVSMPILNGSGNVNGGEGP